MQKDSLAKRLMGSLGKYLVAQGHVLKGPYTIGFGEIYYKEPSRTVATFGPAYRFRDRQKNLSQSIPSKMSEAPYPPQPLLYCKPVADVDIVREVLKKLKFEHTNDQFHIHTENISTPIIPVRHQGIHYFKQDRVDLVNLDEIKIVKTVWP